MKKMKKMFAMLLCLAMILAPVQSFALTAEVQAATAVKREVKYNSKNGRHYLYENGKRITVKNRWVTISGKGTYYFGPGGYALAAPREEKTVYNIVTKKIGGKIYGFDSRARRVTGLYYRMDGTCFYFNSKGVYSQTETKKYRPASSKKTTKEIRGILDKAGKPLKTVNNGSSCFVANATDFAILYKHYQVQYTKENRNGKIHITGIWPR